VALVRIEVDTFDAEVYSPYNPERVEIIRTIPGRSWDKEAKFWSIPANQVPSLVIALQAFGDTVQIHQRPPGDRTPPPGGGRDTSYLELKLRLAKEQNRDLLRENQRLRQEGQRARNESSARRSNWAEDLLSKLSPEQAKQAYRKLALVLHPDVGGPPDLMRDLNVANDLLGERSWR
jgi:hypothetical protein